MKIFQIATEMTPIAKVGGLGDVLMGLTRELIKKGHDVLPIIPAFGSIDMDLLTFQNREDSFQTFFRGVPVRAFIKYYHFDESLPIALLDNEHGLFRNRTKIYEGDDTTPSFFFFCRALVDWMQTHHVTPDVVHFHDWPTAIFPTVYKAVKNQDPPFKTVFTVHNLEYQGRCSWDDLGSIDLANQSSLNPSTLRDPVYSCVNLVKAGLQTSAITTTVSPTYALEVASPEYGQGLDGVIRSQNDRFVGVLNGLDYSYWNPKTDPKIFEQYSSLRFDYIKQAKAKNKQQLFQSLGLPCIDQVPLIASITRLVSQKGIFLIKDLCYQAVDRNIQCIVLGSVPDHQTEQEFSEVDRFLRKHGRGAVFLLNDETLAHRVYAASDMFVVPSLFEPCGLTQLIALRYGSIPIVRKTGGLADTVFDVEDTIRTPNGFTFNEPTSHSFLHAVSRAITVYHRSAQWAALVETAMNQDFSWKKPAEKYCSLYTQSN